MNITNLICSLAILGALAAFPPSARANHSLPSEVVISVRFGPPILPVYAQPLCPGSGYIWVPGYWAYDQGEGYYWVPGTWVLPPEAGLLWTPGYWAYRDDAYYWNDGYWGPEVGFYGGINYGYGYPGRGFYGGYWRDREFYYNRNVNNINTT
jgi:YXWGXW repeat-containing protein